MSSRLCLFLLSAVAAFTLLLPASHAQNTANLPRIVAPVDDSALITLKGGVPGRARPQFDRGRAQASAQLTSVRLVLSRTPQQEAALEKFMAGQIDPSSPNYHHWLTPQQFGQLYGPSDADIQTLVTWLQTQGFTVRPVAPGRLSIAFSGSVAQMEAAFHTEIHTFNANGEEFLSNVKNPSIPAALAPVVSGIAHLDTIQPRPFHVGGGMGTYDPKVKRLTSVEQASQANRPTPSLTTCSTDSNGNCVEYGLYITPADAATIYDSPNSYNPAFIPSIAVAYTGAGVTIGIGGNSPIQSSTVVNYRSRFLGDTTAPIITNLTTDPATNLNDTDEAYIDTELAGGMAPKATIHFYTANDLAAAIEQAATDNTVDIFSLSFGSCEMNLSTAGNAYFNNLWQQFAAQGIAVTVSSGDGGSAGCDNFNTEESAQNGLQVSGYASTPYNIAVGGTDFYKLLTNFGNYVATDSSGTPSGYYRTAGSYIPEATWNDSVTTDGALAQNAPYTDAKTGKTNIVAGAGGKSSCSTNTTTTSGTTTTITCNSGYAKPAWQQGPGVPSDGVRDLPDVSLMAGNGFDTATWLICTDDTGTAGTTTYTTNCADFSYNGQTTFAFAGFGGTSTATPAFAGILAMVQQMDGSRLGIGAAQTLYQLAAGPHASAVFHDVAQGNISVPCVSGSPNCSKNPAGNLFLTGYDTAAGYDLATGLGSVDAAQLINFWQTSSGTQEATIMLDNSAPSAISVSDALVVPITVSGSSSIPTGYVRLIISSIDDSYSTYSASQKLTNGTVTFTVPPYSLHQGGDTIYAIYEGDTTYGQTTSMNSQITVNPITPTVTVTPSSTIVSTATSFTLAVSVAGPANAPVPTGSITIWADNKDIIPPTLLVNGSYTFTIPANTLTVGSTPIQASYGSDATYDFANSTTTVTVTGPPTYALSGTNVSISPGSSGSSTITVSASNAYAGSVTLGCVLTAAPSGAQNQPACSVSGSPITLTSSTTSATGTVKFSTTAPSAVSGKLAKSNALKTGAATLLALLIFFGIPARNRAWRALLSIVVLIAVFGAISACGGSGSSGGGGGNSNPGTTAGNYTFTITGTGNPAVTPAPTTTVTLTVN